MGEVWKEPDEFTERKFFIDHIHDIEYNPILSVINMMSPTANIDTVKE